MRTSRVISLAVVAAALSVPAIASPSQSAEIEPPVVGKVVKITTEKLPNQKLDRIVFRIDGPLPTEYGAEYVDELRADPSDRRINVPGQAIVRLRMFPVDAHTDAGESTVPGRIAYAMPNLITAVRAGDFEAVVSYGLGLAQARPVSIYTRRNPNRVVVDIDTTFARRPAKVWFQNLPNYQDGVEPYTTAVMRQVPARAPAGGVLDRLFAGPTGFERDRGLRLVRSKADDYSHLSISGQVARLRLRGHCASGGSTFTVASEIMPSLRQFPTVTWVKILGPGGNTENPTGTGDSIPECLEP